MEHEFLSFQLMGFTAAMASTKHTCSATPSWPLALHAYNFSTASYYCT